MADAKRMVEEHVYYQQQGIVEDRLDAGILQLEEIDGARFQLPEDEWPTFLQDEYRDYLREQKEYEYGGSFADYVTEIDAEDATYEEREWLSIWLISTELAFRLINKGQMVAVQSDGSWWFRPGTGGAIWQDDVMQEIASEWSIYADPQVAFDVNFLEEVLEVLQKFNSECEYELNDAPFPHEGEGRQTWIDDQKQCNSVEDVIRRAILIQNRMAKGEFRDE